MYEFPDLVSLLLIRGTKLGSRRFGCVDDVLFYVGSFTAARGQQRRRHTNCGCPSGEEAVPFTAEEHMVPKTADLAQVEASFAHKGLGQRWARP